MLHVLRNNLKNVLLTKTLDPWVWVRTPPTQLILVRAGCVSLFHTSYSGKYQPPSVSCLLMVRSGQGQGWCHLVSSCAIHLTMWHWSDVPCSRDAHHSAPMSRPNSNKKNVNAVCIFFDRNISFNGVHSCGKGLFETRDVSLEKWSIPAVFNVPGYGVIGEAIWGSNKT